MIIVESASITTRLVVFTDLDGTLLDHDTYSWEPARPALERLRELAVPLVLVSSKTLAELDEYRSSLGLEHPVVAENGAATWLPDDYFAGSAVQGPVMPARQELQATYLELKESNRYDCKAFFELGVPGIMRETGLSEARAVRANTRVASEPIRWFDSDERAAEFEQAVRARGLRCVRGGRFMHLMANTGKEEAVDRLIRSYTRKWPDSELVSVSLGDGPNDLGMLGVTDIAVVIPGKHRHPMELSSGNTVLRPAATGPAGWNAAMLSILAEYVGDRATSNINGE